MGVCEADVFAGAGVDDVHVSLELAGDDADEGDAVPVLGIHICLDLENEGGEFLGGRLDGVFLAFAWDGWRGELEEAVEEELDAEVVGGGAEEDGGEFSGEDLIHIEVRTGAFEEFQFIANLGVGDFIDGVFDGLVIDAGDVHGGAEGAVDCALEEVDFFVFPVVDAFEAGAVAEGPVYGEGGDAKDGFEFVEEVEGRPRGAV